MITDDHYQRATQALDQGEGILIALAGVAWVQVGDVGIKYVSEGVDDRRRVVPHLVEVDGYGYRPVRIDDRWVLS